MTPTAAEKLLAMLEDGQTIETLSAGEIRDDLALLGIDPAPAIAFAHTLASGHDTPGGRLLGGIDAVEDAEDEIARIESASIEEVRAKIPGGSAATIAAEARRKAGADSNIVGIQRRRRSRVLVWGAPLAGIAASLLVVVVGYEVLTVNYVSAPASRELAQLHDAQPESAPMLERAAPEADALGDGVMAKRARRGTAAQPPTVALGNERREAPADDVVSLEAEDADKGFYRAAPEAAEQKSIAGAGRESPDTGDSTGGLLAEPGLPAQDKPAESFADDSGATPRVVAVLVVDEGLAPESIISQDFPAGRLADRLDEARQVAAGRDVVALIALETPAGRTDFVQVPLSPGMSQQLPPPTPIAGLLGMDATAYDFIALPVP